MNAQPIVIQRFVTASGAIGWLLFRSGQFSAPLAALTDAEMTQLLRDVEWQIQSNGNGGRK